MSNLRITQSQNRDLTSTVGKCQNTKINKYIEDINKKTFQRDIVLLLIDIAEKPEICMDYNISISYYLALYLKCKEEPVLSDAGCLILNAARIYARRVDNIYECLENTMVNFEKVSNTFTDNSHTVNNTSKQKRVTKRTLPQQDYLQEYDLSIMKFKLSTDDKLYEKDISLGNFEPPLRYISDLKSYKEWRRNKKKQKFCENMNECVTTDPALWKYSVIEDFDYEDDIDTKRNYQVFTHTIDHRYSTLRSDMNFVMHFKVKDFVEAEEEEETPTKEISTLCKHSNNLSDNIKNYIALENTILENEYRDCDNNSGLYSLNKRRKRREINSTELVDVPLVHSTEPEVQTPNTTLFNNECNISPDIPAYIPNTILNTNQSIEESILSLENSVPDKHLSNISVDQSSVPDVSLNDTILSDNYIETDNSNSEIFDPDTIIVRLSMDDEGVFFGDLDEVDRAMLNPRVVATDITKSIQKDIRNISNLTVTIDETLEKFVGIIDESHITLTENLNEKSTQNFIELKLNFLKIPEKILRKKVLFELNSEYDLFKNARLKRKTCIDKPARESKLFKLNQDYVNFSQSPFHEPEFLGFTEDEMYHSNYNNADIDRIKSSIEKFRSISLDSGIAIQEVLSNITSVDKITNNIFADSNSSIAENNIEDNLQSEITTTVLSSTLIGSDTESPNFNNSEIISKVGENSSFDDSNHNTDLFDSHTHISTMIQKIHEWHRHLKPILAQSKSRHHFDIFELGTEIISHFPTEIPFQCNRDVITFKNVMNNKDPSYISRYFLSMLLLANSNNISINIENENIDQPCDIENIQLQLLNRKRHIISVEDNIGIQNSKRICSSHDSVLFPKPNKKVITNSKVGKRSDDNDSGFFSETSFAMSLG